MKFRIVKKTDIYGLVSYVVEEKNWLFWNNPHYSSYWSVRFDFGESADFDNLEDAKEALENYVKNRKARENKPKDEIVEELTY